MAAEAVELGCDPGQGYRVRVLGGHDVDVAMLIEQLRLQVRDEIGTMFLEPHPSGGVAAARPRGGRPAGRLVWAGDGGPYAVVIDGRTRSWEEFGRALESFEGWRFRLLIDDIDDVRPQTRR